MSSGIALKDQTAGNASNLIIVHKNIVLWSIWEVCEIEQQERWKIPTKPFSNRQTVRNYHFSLSNASQKLNIETNLSRAQKINLIAKKRWFYKNIYTPVYIEDEHRKCFYRRRGLWTEQKKKIRIPVEMQLMLCWQFVVVRLHLIHMGTVYKFNGKKKGSKQNILDKFFPIWNICFSIKKRM